jgi:hypothetical protein
MSKTITIKLTRSSSTSGPFTISDDWGNVIATEVAISTLINGISYNVDDNITMVTIESTGDYKFKKTKLVSTITPSQFRTSLFTKITSACLWKHLQYNLFNSYYGVTDPYIIEYPISTAPNTVILQSIKGYDKVYKYEPTTTGVFSYTDRIQLDNAWFNQVIIYSNQQCSGVLELVPKPKNNLRAYGTYPIYKSDSKVITYTKSDDYYQFNNFYDIVKDKNQSIAITSCESLSYDGIINQSNMNYTNRTFHKAPIRSKDLKIRYSLTDRSDIHIVSQFILVDTQISYK